ncbi:MAG: iron ABC transporter permease [Anaerolineae bacterium]|nr:iron ABC transporter permease [Anaerolineae bacterium]
MNQRKQRFLILGCLFLVCLTVSVFIGRYPEPYLTPISVLRTDTMAQRLVLYLRIPRILAACMLGMTLAAAGTVLQMIFRNPLVEPGFLGVSQGAAFGAALSIVWLGSSGITTQVLAAFFASLGLILSYLLARYIRYGGWTLRLVLAGIAVSALFSSGNGLLKYVADPLTELPEITFWMLGGLWSITWDEVSLIAPIVLVALIIIFMMRWRLNLLSLDDETAFSLGTAPARERAVLLFAAVLATAAVVSVSGIVGWVGLIVPHITRRIFGADAQWAIPGALLLGGIFVILCDNIGRAALAGEIPLGILTSLIGAALFVFTMVRPQPQESV